MEPEILPIEDEKKERLDRLNDDYWVIDHAPAGVTKHQLEALAGRLKISMRAMAKLLRVSERTLSRYDPEKLLKESVSEHILQIERAVDVGQDVFGDPELFLRWLRHSCEALSGKLPIELLGSITGAKLVRDELVRIDYGVPY
jgi:putative toxin-antitoxin system antitoxin component (TIGR02293 family)